MFIARQPDAPGGDTASAAGAADDHEFAGLEVMAWQADISPAELALRQPLPFTLDPAGDNDDRG